MMNPEDRLTTVESSGSSRQNFSALSMQTRRGGSSILSSRDLPRPEIDEGEMEPEERCTENHVRVFYVSPHRRGRFEFTRLLSVACGILGCCSIGATYSVGILSNGLQRTFGLSQDSITTIIFVGFLMAYVAWPAGWVMDVYGPKVVMGIATSLSVLGWALFSLDFAGLLAGGNVAFLSFVAAIFLWTPVFFDPATMLSNMFMFPLDRGLIVIVQKTFMSLASTVVSLTYGAFFEVKKNHTHHHHHHHDHHNNGTSTKNTSSSTTSTTTTPAPVVADGVDSAEGRSMMQYCGAFAVIALAWGLAALIGVREAPALVLRRKERNARKQEREGKEEEEPEEKNTISAAAEQPSSRLSASPSTDTTRLLSEEDGTGRAALTQEEREQIKHKSDGTFLCFARELSDDEMRDKNNVAAGGRGWCSDAEWAAEPRIEIALIQALGMPTPIARAALSILAFNFIFLSTATLVAVYADLSGRARIALALLANIFIFAFFLLPLMSHFVWPPTRGVRVVVGLTKEEAATSTTKTEAATTPTAASASTSATAAAAAAASSGGENDINEVLMPVPYADNFRRSILSLDSWLFWWALAGISTTGGTLAGNSYQMFDSLANGELDSRAAPLNIGLMGIGGAAGRMIIGALEQYLLTPRRYCSTILLPFPSLVAFLGLVLMPVVPPSVLWLPFFLASAAYGMSWATLLLNARQLFTVDVAQHYLFVFSAGLLSIPLARGALGPWYDAETARQHAAPGKCLGLACVSLPIAIMAGLCLAGTIVSVVFHWRWMKRNGLGVFEAVPKRKK